MTTQRRRRYAQHPRAYAALVVFSALALTLACLALSLAHAG